MEWIEDELERLKEMIEQGHYSEIGCLNFLDEDDLLDDDFTRSQIFDYQQAFMTLAEGYLSEHHPGQFAMYQDWCVHICTMAFKETQLNPKTTCRQP